MKTRSSFLIALTVLMSCRSSCHRMSRPRLRSVLARFRALSPEVAIARGTQQLPAP